MTPDALLYPTPDNPVPGPHTLGFFQGVDGRRLRYAIFRVEDQPVQGTVILLHGRNESIEKYFELIGGFLKRGLWVATFDWRGQAGSDRLLARLPRRGHVRRFSDYEADFEAFLDQVVLPDTRLPFFLLAHSMGGLVALSQAPKLSGRIDRMVLSAPFVALGGQSLSEERVAMLARLASLSGFGRFALTRDRGPLPFPINLLTSDAARFARAERIAQAHPHLVLGPPSARWLHETLRTMRRVRRQEHLTRITVPTLILAPTRDPLVPYHAQEELAAHFRAARLIPIAGARHEVLHEADRYRDQALAAIAAFLPGSVESGLPQQMEEATIV
ncbi:lysophospholipase [Xaviernesmea oryzae]|uniref:Lysophospholipase n=1 Tax=Xaviernesmea oryzae TaxID=464029 RepID=A0A1Q9AZC2_9HYPH|nr:alpha/beta hydrolase [Xaviernesmea oryzae]OLP61040.1 lysophospholipase [Xaviernesmea oryzae]SEL16013.1 lysophospholipase [Xaviernesmea oryzae]